MGKFDIKRKKFSRILPSGVPIEMQIFIADHQDWIMKEDQNKSRKGIEKMFKDCVISIGDVESPPDELFNKILPNDRSYILFETRQESNELNPNFVFDYEWPVKQDGKKRKLRKIVIFDRQDFPRKPYLWVYNEMTRKYYEYKGYSTEEIQKIEITPETQSEILDNDFPEMYDNYETMLSENSNQKVTLPNSTAVVHYKLINFGAQKAHLINSRNKEMSSHAHILLHDPVYA